jgi:transcriptional regulator with XRE-family HTH domain
VCYLGSDATQAARAVFSFNLRTMMKREDKTQTDIVRDLHFTASTVSDWVLGKKYPRVDKLQALADYLHCLKSDLTEINKETRPLLSERVMKRLREDPEFREIFEFLLNVEPESLSAIKQLAKQLSSKRAL